MRIFFQFGIVAWFVSGVLLSPAWAAEKFGEQFPDAIELASKKLVLNGIGIRTATFFKIKVYVAALYLEKKSSSEAEILSSDQYKKISLKFLYEVSEKDLRKAWEASFKENCEKNCERIRAPLDQLKQAMPVARKGDRMEYEFYPDRVDVFSNSKKIVTVPGVEFSKFLVSTWLGKNPPTETLKEGMLGKSDSD